MMTDHGGGAEDRGAEIHGDDVLGAEGAANGHRGSGAAWDAKSPFTQTMEKLGASAAVGFQAFGEALMRLLDLLKVPKAIDWLIDPWDSGEEVHGGHLRWYVQMGRRQHGVPRRCMQCRRTVGGRGLGTQRDQFMNGGNDRHGQRAAGAGDAVLDGRPVRTDGGGRP